MKDKYSLQLKKIELLYEEGKVSLLEMNTLLMLLSAFRYMDENGYIKEDVIWETIYYRFLEEIEQRDIY